MTLAAVLDGIAAKTDPGPPQEERAEGNTLEGTLPRGWLDAIEAFERSGAMKEALGETLHRAFVAVKYAEWERLVHEVSNSEWDLYGFVV